jgi:hypothetical protein
MKTIRTTLVVDAEHRATLQLPAEVPPGAHRVVLVIDEPTPPDPAARGPLTFSAHDVGPWPEGFTLRREDLYDDSGRGA